MTVGKKQSPPAGDEKKTIYDRFRGFAHAVASAVGHPAAFGLTMLIVVVWLITGPFFHYSDTWQLTINTGTSVITFLMVFVIQNTQNRESQALQLKLDELIRAMKDARNEMVSIEDLSDEDLHRLKKEFEHVRQAAEAGQSPRPTAPDRDKRSGA